MKKIVFYFLITTTIFTLSCKKKTNDDGTSDPGFNIFTLEDDRKLGESLEAEINTDPKTYPIVDSVKYPKAYQELHRIVDKVLNSGKVVHRNDFKWRVKIIKNDSVLNAFCGPGGKIYVYTGIIKYLKREDHLAGVIGHEIAHADRRHITEQMTKQYGVSVLVDLISGNTSKITEIAAGLVLLKFSREHETDADNYSVVYLCPTEYKADGAAGFFEKLIADQQSGWNPEFLSTHPNPDNRVANIRTVAGNNNCQGQVTGEGTYQALVNALP